MAKRPINVKKARRVRKAFRSTPPAFLDLIQYLKDRRLAQTTGEAERIILAGRVRADSHKLGITKGRKLKPNSVLLAASGKTGDDLFDETDVVDRYVPAALRASIQVLPA